MEVILSEEQLNQVRADIIVINFYAEWCNPNKLLSPSILEVLEQYKSNSRIKFFKVNIEKSPELTKKYNISNIPMIMFLYNKKTDFLPGLIARKEVINKIEALLSEEIN